MLDVLAMHNKYSEVYADLKAHALESSPLECCGLVVTTKTGFKYIRCNNLHKQVENFILDPQDYIRIEDEGYNIVAIAHSHVSSPARFSDTDKASIERGDLDWVLYSILQDSFIETSPNKRDVPYIGRHYVYGVQDCYTIIRDYYRRELNIILPEPPPQDPTDSNFGEGLYKLFEEYGFVEILPKDLKPSDCIIMCIGNKSRQPTHAGIYLGENVILHHAANRISCRETYGSYWMKYTWKCVRHKSLI